jgi:hypothetical protein
MAKKIQVQANQLTIKRVTKAYLGSTPSAFVKREATTFVVSQASWQSYIGEAVSVSQIRFFSDMRSNNQNLLSLFSMAGINRNQSYTVNQLSELLLPLDTAISINPFLSYNEKVKAVRVKYFGQTIDLARTFVGPPETYADKMFVVGTTKFVLGKDTVVNLGSTPTDWSITNVQGGILSQDFDGKSSNPAAKWFAAIR